MDSKQERTSARHALRGMELSMEYLEPFEGIGHIQMAQAAFWAATLDEMLWSLGGYQRVRDADPDGSVVAGVRFIRNAVTHGSVVCEERHEGLTWPMTWPIQWSRTVWAPTTAILTTWQARTTGHFSDEKSSYEKHFDGKPVLEPLTRVIQWFKTAESQGFILR